MTKKLTTATDCIFVGDQNVMAAGSRGPQLFESAARLIGG